jgi:hypothetical protein
LKVWVAWQDFWATTHLHEIIMMPNNLVKYAKGLLLIFNQNLMATDGLPNGAR